MSEISITQERLRNLRAQSGKNQDEVAEECGISRIALARYEGGQRMPKMNILAKLAECYGVTVDYLMGRDEPVQEDQESIPAYLQESYDLLLQLTPEEYAEILEMAKFKLYQRQNGKNEKA